MKKEELIELGLSEEQATKVFELHGKSVTKAQKEVETLKAQNAEIQTNLDTANATLEKFKDVDVDSIKSEIERYKQETKNLKADYWRLLNSLSN